MKKNDYLFGGIIGIMTVYLMYRILPLGLFLICLFTAIKIVVSVLVKE